MNANQDELTLLRKVRDDVAEPSTTAVNAGRAALLEAAGPTVARSAKRHRGLKRAGWTTLGVVGAAAIAATLVLTNVVGLAGWRGGADAAAADSLGRAAAATIRTSDPVVGPGQFLKITTTAVYTVDGEHGTYLQSENGEMYIPANRDDDWVWVRPPSEVVQTFGSESSKQAANDHKTPVATEVVRAAKGAFYNGRPMDFGLDALPRDPQQLLNYIYRTTAGAGVSPDGEALVFIADTLRTGVVPADLRAALYQALAGIPGVEITDNQATLDGRTGVAFGRDESNGLRQEIVIDPTTGQLIGEREVVLRVGVLPHVPAGTVSGSTSVSTSIVDSAPAGGTLCGALGHPAGKPGGGQCQTDN